MSTFLHSHDWKHAANYVAKRYIEEVDRNVYFEDVRLQMDAKLWAEEYNRHNPPKKVVVHLKGMLIKVQNAAQVSTLKMLFQVPV